MRRRIVWVPLIVAAIVIALFAWPLVSPPNRAIQSALIGQPVPEFALAPGALSYAHTMYKPDTTAISQIEATTQR